MTTSNESDRSKRRLRLAAARRRRGWGQVRAAIAINELGLRLGYPENELRVDAHALSRWERGVHEPKARYIRIMCSLYELPADQLDLAPPMADGGPPTSPSPDTATAPLRSAFAPAPNADAEADGPVHSTDVERREFMEHVLAAFGGGLVYDLGRFSAARRGLAQDRYVIGHLRQATANLARDSWTESPHSILPLVRLQLTYQLPLVHASTGGSHRELMAVACETATIAGRLAWMSDNRGDAAQHLRLAEDLAKEAQDLLLRARVLAEQRNLWTTVHSGGIELRSDHALAAIDEAVTAAGSDAPPMLRVWLLNLRADEHAIHGHERECYRDLDEAERAFAKVKQPDGFFQHWSTQRQARFRGGCAVLLGHWRAGISSLERLLGEMSPSLAGPYATTAADLAAAYAEEGETERACELLHAALDVVEAGALIRGGLTYIRGVRLVNVRSDARHVKSLDERLRALPY